MLQLTHLHSYLYIFMLLLALVFIYSVRVFISQSKLHKSFSQRIMKFYWDDVNWKSFGFYKFIFFFIATVFAAISLMRPQFGQKKVSISSKGVEMVFAVDISKSMATQDIRPSRLSLARIQLTKLFKELQGNKMGLIAFSGQVGVVSPLTTDISALTLFLDSLDFETITEQGTNIKDALAEAQELLQGTKDKPRQFTGNQVVMLVTDGEDHSRDTLEEVKKLYKAGIYTFVIGVGSKEGGKIPITDGLGQNLGFMRDKSNKIITSKPNFKFLQALAKAGGGGFYTLGFNNRMFEAIEKDLGRIKKSSFDSENFEVQDEYFQWPLILAILFYILSFIATSTDKTHQLRSLKYIEDME